MAGGLVLVGGWWICRDFNENNKSFICSLIHLLAPHALNALSFPLKVFSECGCFRFRLGFFFIIELYGSRPFVCT